MFKNTAGQKLTVFAFNATTNLPTVGDGANLTAYVSKDGGAVTALADVTATEQSGANAAGYYDFDLSQAETNGDKLMFSGKSSTANVVVIACPPVVYTVAPNFNLQNIDASGRQLLQPAQPGVTIPTVTTLTNDPAGTTTMLARLTAIRAGYLDKLNVTGNVASQADVLAINQSASRRIIVSTVAQYERPEAGSTDYTIEVRTYDPDGSPVDATDGGPFLAVDGMNFGDLSSHIVGTSFPATGVKRFTYRVVPSDLLLQLRMDATANLPDGTFTMSAYTQVTDFVASTWTAADRVVLQSLDTRIPAALGANGNLKADIRDYNGIAGAFLNGRPEVKLGNVAHGGPAMTIQFLQMVGQATTFPAFVLATGTGSAAVFTGGTVGAGLELIGGASAPGLKSTGGSGAAGHGAVFTRGSILSDDILLTNSDAPTMAANVWNFVIEGVLTAAQLFRGLVAMAFGLSDGGGGSPIHFKDQANTKNRITATCDNNGNRTAVVTDLN
jgi:hypothetical protein